MARWLENDVLVAFEVLLEEIESAAEALNKKGKEAFDKGNYDDARLLSEKGSQMAAFRERVKEMQKEWRNLFSSRELGGGRKKEGRRGRKTGPRLPRGLRTPEEFFREPILLALLELGGSAPMQQVLDRVLEATKEQLNEHDFQSLPSDPACPRWRNTAQWCRNSLVKEGLMKADSRRGIWELSEEGDKLAGSLRMK